MAKKRTYPVLVGFNVSTGKHRDDKRWERGERVREGELKPETVEALPQMGALGSPQDGEEDEDG